MNATKTPPPPSIDGVPASYEELALAVAIIDAFNEANRSSYSLTTTHGEPTNELRILLRRIRESPEVELEEHRRIIAANFANPWWAEPKAGSVAAIYGERTWPRCRVNNGIRRSGRTVRRSVDRPGRTERKEPW
jgi:hypothetical protein